MVTLNLDKIFNPKNIAVIGANDEDGTMGHSIAKNFTKQGPEIGVFFVSLRKTEIMGKKTYPSIDKIPTQVDLAVIETPPRVVPEIIEQCGKANVKGVIILSKGFRELGNEGKALESRILETSKKYEIRVIGPNCLGLIKPRINLNATYIENTPKSGNIAFISQDNALASTILDWAIHENVGFSNFVSLGSMIDVDFGDLIDYFGTDPKTKSILMHVENITNARKFMSAARHFARTKPIIVVRSGKFKNQDLYTRPSVCSPTNEDEVYNAAFKRAGIVRVQEITELFDAAEVLSTQPLPKGPNLVIITNANGMGVMARDALISKGGKLAKLSQKTFDTLNASLPSSWSKTNPIDILPDAKADRYRLSVETCLKDENVDGILILLVPQPESEPQKTAESIIQIIRSQAYQNKTILTAFMGFEAIQNANSLLDANNIPTYSTPEGAIKTYMTMYQYQCNIDLLYETPEELPIDVSPPKRPLMMILRAVANENRELMQEDEAKKFLKYYNFKVAPTFVVNNIDDALADARRAGYPVTMKLLAPQMPNDAEINNLSLNANSDSEVKETFENMFQNVRNQKPDTQTILVAIRPTKKNGGTEIMLRSRTDPVFGPVVAFGMGGTNGNLLDDCSIGLPPLNATLIRRMMEETKVYQLLSANKKMPSASLQLLEETILLFSQLIIDFPQLKEVEINPLIVNEKETRIQEARITLDKEMVFQKIEPHQHLVISPYPRKYETRWTLRNGQEVLLRPIKPEDEKLWLEMFKNFSEESIRYRFFQILKDTPHEVRVRYCNIDYDREMAIVAEITQEDKKKILGVSRISIEPSGKRGEMAFIVTDKWQGQGLGTKMVDYLLEVAKEMGVEEVYSIMLPDNQRALRLTQKMGFQLEYLNDGNVKGTLGLKEEIKEHKPPLKEAPSQQPLKQEKPAEPVKQEIQKSNLQQEAKQSAHSEPEMAST